MPDLPVGRHEGNVESRIFHSDRGSGIWYGQKEGIKVFKASK
jgi:hypothetical protein